MKGVLGPRAVWARAEVLPGRCSFIRGSYNEASYLQGLWD